MVFLLNPQVTRLKGVLGKFPDHMPASPQDVAFAHNQARAGCDQLFPVSEDVRLERGSRH